MLTSSAPKLSTTIRCPLSPSASSCNRWPSCSKARCSKPMGLPVAQSGSAATKSWSADPGTELRHSRNQECQMCDFDKYCYMLRIRHLRILESSKWLSQNEKSELASNCLLTNDLIACQIWSLWLPSSKHQARVTKTQRSSSKRYFTTDQSASNS